MQRTNSKSLVEHIIYKEKPITDPRSAGSLTLKTDLTFVQQAPN